jgi:hypothetical protein
MKSTLLSPIILAIQQDRIIDTFTISGYDTKTTQKQAT